MTPPPIDEIFGQALDLSATQRARYLAAACGSDAWAVSEVASLLRAHAEAGPFMERATQAHAYASDDVVGRERPGAVIGRYRLLQQIGEGGFGAVFLAEQHEPVARRVALKVIKAGMDTRQVIARFEAERQTLALMDHPNIARVLDAGATDSGRPYFVMQLVHGAPITTYAHRERLSIRERLELFQEVCHAVMHAHQKGIIHRDLKPSNILVAKVDGRAFPKIIDFGIAKATGGEAEGLTQRTLLTQARQFMGTPEYMSPEQALTGSLDIDTRADIYSLGAMLYELLTGTTPLQAEAVRSAGFAELQRMIREDEPPRPSVRLSSLTRTDAAPTPHETEIAGHRGAHPPHLVRLIRGDLDWVVMKCLEKDRTRRYETANALALDIGRHLASEPVVAAPPSRVYRVRKFVTRNRGTVAAAATIVLVLALGMIGTSSALMRARAAESKAQEHSDELQEMVAFLESQLADMDVVLLHTGSPGERWRALPRLKEAAEERERVLGLHHRSTLSSLVLLAEGLLRHRQSREAEQCLHRALAASEGVLTHGDPLVIMMHSLLGTALQRLGRLSEAEMSGAQAVTHARTRYTGQPSMAGSFAMVLVRYGDTLRAAKRFEEAEAVFLEAHASHWEHALAAHTRPGKPAQRLVALYQEWHTAEPGAGHDAKAAHWRACCRDVPAVVQGRDSTPGRW
jgi:serine/threonine protein kinase